MCARYLFIYGCLDRCVAERRAHAARDAGVPREMGVLRETGVPRDERRAVGVPRFVKMCRGGHRELIDRGGSTRESHKGGVNKPNTGQLT